MVISEDKVHLFISESQVSGQVKDHLKPQKSVNDIVEIHDYTAISRFLEEIAKGSDKKIWLPSTVSYGIASIVPPKQAVVGISPVALMKCIKNPVEVDGFVNCHVKDAAALCSYFAWLEKKAGSPELDEISGADELERLR